MDGQGGDVNMAEHTYDPWYDGPQDPETDREPTYDQDSLSDTGPRL